MRSVLILLICFVPMIMCSCDYLDFIKDSTDAIHFSTAPIGGGIGFIPVYPSTGPTMHPAGR